MENQEEFVVVDHEDKPKKREKVDIDSISK